MKSIPLSQGKVALVDDGDYESLSRYKWCAKFCDGKWYAARSTGGRLNLQRLYMHRVILQAQSDQMVDHRNRDGLDNRRSNIRIATPGQNQYNSIRPRSNTSGFKGVQRGRNGHGWQAVIKVEKKTKYLGQFPTKEEAAQAYDRAAKQYHGEFARLSMEG